MLAHHLIGNINIWPMSAIGQLNDSSSVRCEMNWPTLFQVRGTAAAAPRASGCTSVTPRFRRYQSQGYSTLRHICSSTRSCSSVTSSTDSSRHPFDPPLLRARARARALSLGEGKGSSAPPSSYYLRALTGRDAHFNTCRWPNYFTQRWSISNFYFMWWVSAGSDMTATKLQVKLSQSGMSECMCFSGLTGGESLHAKLCRWFLIGSISMCLYT